MGGPGVHTKKKNRAHAQGRCLLVKWILLASAGVQTWRERQDHGKGAGPSCPDSQIAAAKWKGMPSPGDQSSAFKGPLFRVVSSPARPGGRASLLPSGPSAWGKGAAQECRPRHSRRVKAARARGCARRWPSLARIATSLSWLPLARSSAVFQVLLWLSHASPRNDADVERWREALKKLDTTQLLPKPNP